MTEEALARVEAFTDRWNARVGFGAQTSDLVYAVTVHGFDGDAELRASDLTALLSLARQAVGMEAALLKAQHALVTADNYRVTDLDVETFEAHLNNGVPRDRLEFMTDFADELAVIDAALSQSRSEK